jgi:hypothetical protein
MRSKPRITAGELTAMPAIAPPDNEELLVLCEAGLAVVVDGAATLVELAGAALDVAGVAAAVAPTVVAIACATVKLNVDTNEVCPRSYRLREGTRSASKP